MLKRRPYQDDGIGQIIDYAMAKPTGRLLAVLPARGGKTVIGGTVMKIMAHDQGLHGLWIAHGRALVDQAVEQLLMCEIPEKNIGTIMSGDRRSSPEALVQIASVDTLFRRKRPEAQLVVSDEAHHDASNGRRALRSAYDGKAFQLGLTGTPARLDGRGLKNDYDDMIVIAVPSELIATQHLLVPRIFTVPEEDLPDLSDVRLKQGDFDPVALERLTDRSILIGNIVEHWGKLAEGRTTILFPTGVQHSHHLIDCFNANGVRAKHLDGTTTTPERKAIFEELRNGTLKVVSSCGVLNEGIDLPIVKCVVQARPTQSLTLHIQQTSRCMTPYNDISALILDHAGNMLRPGLGLPYDDRDWQFELGFENGLKTQKPKATVKACDKCGAVMKIELKKCPECGSPMEAKVRESGKSGSVHIPSETTGDLREIVASVEQYAKAKEQITNFAQAKGFPPDWVAKVLKAKFAHA